MRPLSILVADDVQEVRDSIEDCLLKGGHTVVCAATGGSALKMLNQQPFDLLITDVLMPDGDGLTVLMGIRKAKLSVRVIAISGGGSYLTAENCIRTAKGLGAHAVLFKPFLPQALFGAIDRAMGEPAAA